MRKEEHVTESIPAYTLGCLDDDEATLVARHLDGCAFCQAELRAYQEVVGELAVAAPQVEPPAGLKNIILERARASRPQPGDREAQPSFWRQLLRGGARYSPAWALAGIVLLVMMATSNLLLWREVSQLRAFQAESLRTVSLQGTDLVPAARGLIVISADGNHGTLVVDELPVLDESRQYQLWLIRAEERTSGAVFSVGPDGYGSVWVSAPEPLVSYSRFGITIEPAGGSPGPTGDRVMAGDM